VFIDVTVIYSINPTEANTVHRRWQNRYQNAFIRPTLRGFVRDVVSRFGAEEIVGRRRTEMQEALTELMRARMEEEGFILTDLVVRNITFTPEFAESIERKQIAEQQALEAQFRVQQEQQEAERVRVRAQGQRDAAITVAEGEARAIVLRAQAQAEALRLVSAQIAANPTLIQYLYVQNLSDNIRLAVLPSDTPFLFDFASLGEPIQDFVPPDVPDANIPSVTDVTPPPTPDDSGGSSDN
jgi:regulator of protease activity HflC (stomatin/prohibitin superfamily)